MALVTGTLSNSRNSSIHRTEGTVTANSKQHIRSAISNISNTGHNNSKKRCILVVPIVPGKK